MSETVGSEAVHELSRRLSDGRIPDGLRPNAEALIARLTQPVRVTVFGLPGSGKSTLVNLLLGAVVLGPDGRLPTTQIGWGKTPRSRCTMADGSTRDFDHFDATEIAATSPIFVKAELPLPALGKISVMEVVAGTAGDLKRAIRWASSRTDIALWCTQRFNSPEQTLWATATDDMKDHGFLVVTKADEAVAQGVLDSTLAVIQEHAGEEFNRILPISTHDAIGARREDGSIDKDRLTRSGGRALIAAILRDVELGSQAARDQAEILLRQIGGEPQVAEAPRDEETPQMAEDAPADMPVPDAKEAAPETHVREEPEEQESAAEAIESAITGAAEPAITEATAPHSLSASARAACETAIGKLVQHGRRAADGLTTPDDMDIDQLMQETIDSVQWLSDYLGEKAGEDAVTFARLRDAAYDAADLLQLMQMEKDTGSVKESVSIVIQLKREMEAALAA